MSMATTAYRLTITADTMLDAQLEAALLTALNTLADTLAPPMLIATGDRRPTPRPTIVLTLEDLNGAQSILTVLAGGAYEEATPPPKAP